MKCTCDYCHFQSVGVAKEAVQFVDQTEAKKELLDFVYNAFRESHPQRRAEGLSENNIAIMLAEWGLGKTQLLKYLRTAINNSAGISTRLRDEYDIAFADSPALGQVTLESFVRDVELEDPEYGPRAQEHLTLMRERRGAAFRIDALSFYDEIGGEPNLLVPLFNIVLRRCQIDHRVTEETLADASRLILDRLGVDRLFVLFDELEALRTVETGALQFDRFFQSFAVRLKSVVDNSMPPDVSICLATIPSVWEALTRQFEELGALRSRAAFIELTPLSLEKAHQFILSRCRTAENSPFTDGTIHTLLEATGNNPRYLNRVCFDLQPILRNTATAQHRPVVEYLGGKATDRTEFTYDHQALLELKDACAEGLADLQIASELLNILTGELREYSPSQLRPYLGKAEVPKIEQGLNRLCSTRLRGLHSVTKLIRLDRSKALMAGKSLREQVRHLVAQHYLSESDVRIEKQRLLVHDLDYERQVVAPLEARSISGSPTEYYLPVDDEAGCEELTALWSLAEGPALEICRTLRSLALVPHNAPLYRLSMAARERIFPRQSPKEPPFEWVDEAFWRDAFAHVHDPSTPRQEKRRLLLNGLRLTGQSYGAKCSAVDDTAFLWLLEEPGRKNARYTEDRPLRALVQLVSDTKDLNTPEFRNRQLSTQADFLICVSSTHLPDRPKVIPTPEGRPEIEVIYQELSTREEFKFQLLSRLNEEATSRNWYQPAKMQAAQESIADNVYGRVVDIWLECAQGTGYLVQEWDMPHGVREDSLGRVLREIVTTIPDQPATFDDIMGRLRQLGMRESLEDELVHVLEDNGQLIRDNQDRLKIQLLPTQERIVALSDRVGRQHGESREDYAKRVAQYFWQGPRTELVRELTRHVLVVEELGYFDGYTDLDMVLHRIDEKLDKVKKKDRYEATIDQYAYAARRGQIGAKRAERLSRERDYFQEQYRLYDLDFQRIDQDRSLVIPRVVRHQLIDIEKRLQEIIATGEGPYEAGKKAVQQAQQMLETTHYDLVAGAEIKIKEHTESLANRNDDPLLKDVVAAHRDGVVADDEIKGQRSAHSLAKQLEERLNELKAERDSTQRAIDQYREHHQALMVQADRLSKQPGLRPRAEAQQNQLRRADPVTMFQIFKDALESSGLQPGEKKIRDALAGLDKIEAELADIGRLEQDLQRLSTIIEQFRNKEHLLTDLIEPSQMMLWRETYTLAFVAKEASKILEKVRTALEKLKTLQAEYRATQTEREMLDEKEQSVAKVGEEVESLRKEKELALRQAEERVGVQENPFEAGIGRAKEISPWAAQIAEGAETAFRAELQKDLLRTFKALSGQEFHELSERAATTLDQGFQVIEGIIELAGWLNDDTVRIQGYVGTDLEQDARRLLARRDDIAKRCSSLARLRQWTTLYDKLERLIEIGGGSTGTSGLVPDLERQVEELNERASIRADDRMSGVQRFVEALLAAKLLDVQRRQELLDRLNEVRQADYSYRETLLAVEQLNQQVSHAARSQLQAKGQSGGYDPDVALAIVQEIHTRQNLPIRQALSLDQTEGNTILWLIQQGVLDGQLHLMGG